jgi:ankyrin repeat protein
MPVKKHVSTLRRFEKVLEDKNTPILNEQNLRLFLAVTLGTKAEVSQAIKDGADVNAVNLNHVCPLELARAYKRKDVAKILELNGAHLPQPTPPKKRASKKH